MSCILECGFSFELYRKLLSGDITMLYLSTTFSPTMLSPGKDKAIVGECSLDFIKQKLQHGFRSVVGHQVTAAILETLLGTDVPFNRTRVQLETGDILLCVIPNFRADESREFTFQEVASAGFRCFEVTVESRA